ncbi:MAG: cupin domain-containing protein [Pseudomonadota bacterium]
MMNPRSNPHPTGAWWCLPSAIICLLLVGSLVGGSPTNAEESLAHSPIGPVRAADLIQALQLEGHVEGGFYRRTYEAHNSARIPTEDGQRFAMTSIFYLLTDAGPIGHFHKNRSDIVHYFHGGNPIDYFLIHADGSLKTFTMGPDPRLGHLLQLTVEGGVWKASRLQKSANADFGLISEAVSPGFDYADMTLGNRDDLKRLFPQHIELIKALAQD